MQYYLDKYRKKLYAEFRNILILTSSLKTVSCLNCSKLFLANFAKVQLDTVTKVHIYVRCSFKMRRLSQDTILSKKPKMTCRMKKVCSEFESNLCNMITTSSKEVIFL